MKTTIAAWLVLLLPAAPAVAQAPAHNPQHPTNQPIDPVGIYDLNLSMHGQTMATVLIISKEKNGSLRGILEVHGQPITLDSVSVHHREIRLSGGPEMLLTLTLTEGHSFTGKWARGSDSGTCDGTRRPL